MQTSPPVHGVATGDQGLGATNRAPPQPPLRLKVLAKHPLNAFMKVFWLQSVESLDSCSVVVEKSASFRGVLDCSPERHRMLYDVIDADVGFASPPLAPSLAGRTIRGCAAPIEAIQRNSRHSRLRELNFRGGNTSRRDPDSRFHCH